MKISYVNGAYIPHAKSRVSIDDRGYQFADGVYEYIAFYNECLLDVDLHLARLARSLKELSINPPMSMNSLVIVMNELIERNRRLDGGLYMQITRGEAKRDHAFPASATSSLVITICAPKYPKEEEVKNGASVITSSDQRWKRCDIKSTALLANILAKQEAVEHQAREAWLVNDDGNITEGAVSNAYIVNSANEIITHPADKRILGGVTREVVLNLARANNITIIERPFSLREVIAAKEAFITSTSANVLPVCKINNNNVGNGKLGAITKKLMSLYHSHIESQTGKKF